MDMNNEMDELFRKAGEDYPLNLGKADWDAVAGRLSAAGSASGPGFGVPAASPGKGRRNRWLLLLLLPAGIYGMLQWCNGSLSPVSGKPVAADSQPRSAAATTRSVIAGSGSSGASVVRAGRILPPGRKKKMNGVLLTERPVADKNPAGGPARFDDNQQMMPRDTVRHADTGAAPKQSPSPDNGLTGTEYGPGPLAESVMENLANAPGEGKAKKNSPVISASVKRQRGLYAGLTAAPDFSTVKFQAIKSTGYSFGIVAGYRFNRHFSVESGLSWDRKKYFSEGKYFDKSRTKIPSTVTVTYIDGYCEMFEIPVTLRYNLSTGRIGHWFAAAGFSSYLMKNENYLYGAETNNIPWSRKVDYRNSGNDFFSIFQISAGYEYNLNARNRIRIEPYLKVPVSGIGIGSLPVSSLGVTFGYLHPFH